MQSGATMPSLPGFAALTPAQAREEITVPILEEAMDEHLERQQRMRQPLSYLTAEVGDIMY